MGVTVYKLDENLVCKCGHIWEEHHHGVVLNPKYYDYPLTIRGCIAQECEHNQVNGDYFLNKGETTYCKCDSFRPKSVNVQKLVKEWVKKNDPR